MNTTSEFDFLTSETVRLSEALSDTEFEKEFILSSFGELAGNSLCDSAPVVNYPDTAGILFNISLSGNTLSLRGFATDSIKYSAEEVNCGNKSYLRTLRLEQHELDEKLCFLEMDSEDQAEVVVDNMFNKRFPIEEDILCNISDPGFSWWYTKTVDGFRINFKSHKYIEGDQRVKLGPIGDVVVASILLGRLENHFKHHIPISEIIISEKQFFIKSSDPTHPVLKELMNVFERGELSEDSALVCELDQSLKLYLQEISAMRRFWIFVEQQLIKKTRILN